MRDISMIVWRDSVSLGGWKYKSEINDWHGREIVTTGFVIHESLSDLIVAQSYGDAGDGEVFCNFTSIPTQAIVKRILLVVKTESAVERSDRSTHPFVFPPCQTEKYGGDHCGFCGGDVKANCESRGFQAAKKIRDDEVAAFGCDEEARTGVRCASWCRSTLCPASIIGLTP